MVGQNPTCGQTSTSPVPGIVVAAVGVDAIAVAVVSAGNSIRPRQPFGKDVISLVAFSKTLGFEAVDGSALECHSGSRSFALKDLRAIASWAEQCARKCCSRTWIRLNTDSTAPPLPRAASVYYPLLLLLLPVVDPEAVDCSSRCRRQ